MKIRLFLILTIFFFSCTTDETQTGEMSVSEEVTADQSKENEKVKVPVEAYIVKKSKVEEKLPFSAVLKPSHSVDIVSEASGKIVRINKEVGSVVVKNEVLAIIDDVVAKSNFEQAKAQVLTAENNLKIAQLNLKSDKQLFENGDISQLQYDNSQLAVKTAEANHLAALAAKKLMQKQFDDTRIESPIRGIVARKFIEMGEMVNPSFSVYRVVDLEELKLEIGVPQTMISNIRIGDEAEILISALNNKVFKGHVKYISPQADESTGAFMTEIRVNNTPDKIIRAGMSAKVNLILTTKDEKLVVPNYSLISKNGDKKLYKIHKETAKLVPVDIGESYGSNLVIEDGVQEGDTIVVVGMKNLGIKTKVLIESLHNP